MKVLYLIQTHKNPEQIYRLVQTIKKSSPKSFVLISHDIKGCYLDESPLRNLPDVEVIRGEGGRADFSIIQGYLDAVEWLLSRKIQFDWLFNISGQDYPTQPLPQVERFLAETKYDGFLEYFDVLSDSEQNLWGSREGRDRYLYQYWRSGGYLSTWQRALVKIPRMAINNVQSLIRINSSYGLMVGLRSSSSPFNDLFVCYAGSYFHTLSRKCVEYVYNFCKQNPSIIKYYINACQPEESLIQTILVNSRLFSLCNDKKRYIDWTEKHLGHPRTLTTKDYPSLIQSNSHFARKFDIKQDRKILDMLDARVLLS